MKRSNFCLMLMIAFIGVFIGWTTCEASVMIRGKAISEIHDVVKQATGSEFPEIQKHSLLFYERLSYNGNFIMQPRILTISADGSLNKEYVVEGNELDTVSTALDPTSTAVQRFDVAMSDKRFGRRRNIMFVTSGLGGYQIAKGLKTLQSDGSDEDPKISIVNGDCTLHKNNMSTNIQGMNAWGSGHMTIKGIDSDVFVYASTPQMGQNGILLFRFIAADRNESGDVSYEVNYRHL